MVKNMFKIKKGKSLLALLGFKKESASHGDYAIIVVWYEFMCFLTVPFFVPIVINLDLFFVALDNLYVIILIFLFSSLIAIISFFSAIKQFYFEQWYKYTLILINLFSTLLVLLLVIRFILAIVFGIFLIYNNASKIYENISLIIYGDDSSTTLRPDYSNTFLVAASKKERLTNFYEESRVTFQALYTERTQQPHVTNITGNNNSNNNNAIENSNTMDPTGLSPREAYEGTLLLLRKSVTGKTEESILTALGKLWDKKGSDLDYFHKKNPFFGLMYTEFAMSAFGLGIEEKLRAFEHQRQTNLFDKLGTLPMVGGRSLVSNLEHLRPFVAELGVKDLINEKFAEATEEDSKDLNLLMPDEQHYTYQKSERMLKDLSLERVDIAGISPNGEAQFEPGQVALLPLNTKFKHFTEALTMPDLLKKIALKNRHLLDDDLYPTTRRPFISSLADYGALIVYKHMANLDVHSGQRAGYSPGDPANIRLIFVDDEGNLYRSVKVPHDMSVNDARELDPDVERAIFLFVNRVVANFSAVGNKLMSILLEVGYFDLFDLRSFEDVRDDILASRPYRKLTFSIEQYNSRPVCDMKKITSAFETLTRPKEMPPELLINIRGIMESNVIATAYKALGYMSTLFHNSIDFILNHIWLGSKHPITPTVTPVYNDIDSDVSDINDMSDDEISPVIKALEANFGKTVVKECSVEADVSLRRIIVTENRIIETTNIAGNVLGLRRVVDLPDVILYDMMDYDRFMESGYHVNAMVVRHSS